MTVSGHALCSWLIWSSHRLFSRNAGEADSDEGGLAHLSPLFDQKHV